MHIFPGLIHENRPLIGAHSDPRGILRRATETMPHGQRMPLWLCGPPYMYGSIIPHGPLVQYAVDGSVEYEQKPLQN